jgi:hypothetical protein
MQQRENRRFKRWTSEEDNIIIKCIEEDPSNIVRATRRASLELGRSSGSVRNRWYTVIAPPNRNVRDNTVFVTIGNTQFNPNRKVHTNNRCNCKQQPIPKRRSMWHMVKNLLFRGSE